MKTPSVLNIEELYKIYQSHPVIGTDTRNLPESCIFFALKGNNFNGNKFAKQALDSGAAYCVVDEFQEENDKFILVENVLQTLQQLAAYHRQQLNIPFVAIAGSNGKTTTKELVHSVLSQKFNVATTPGNLNNHIGVPLTLLKINELHEIAVVEIGANHLQETAFLCEIIKPNFGLITNNGKDHLEGFGILENVRIANGELFDYLKKVSGKVFVSSFQPDLMQMSQGLERITYGANDDDYVQGEADEDFETLYVNLFSPKWASINTQLFGKFNLENVLAAVAIGTYFGVEFEKIIEAIEAYQPKLNRSQMIEVEGIKYILDAYNANPSSMLSALESFFSAKFRRRGLILGDMLELGDFSRQEHNAIIEYLKTQKVDDLWLVGEEFAKTPKLKNAKYYLTAEEMKPDFLRNKKIGFTYLIKGSRRLKLEELLM